MKLIKKLKENTGRRKEKLSIAALSALVSTTLIKAKIAFANDFDFLTGKGNGTFDKANEMAKETGASLYSFLRTIGIIGLVVSIIFCAFSFSSKNANKREEGKNHILWISVSGIVIFGAMALIGILSNIGGALNS